VLESALRLVALVAAAFVLMSFAMFARDQFSGASKHQQAEIASNSPRSPGVAPPSGRPGQPRRFIDDAARKLESPFAHIADSSDRWVRHGIPALLGLGLYGFGLGFAARYARGRS
jgi:hypothetical protein